MKKAKTTRYRSVAIALDHPLAQDSGNGYGKVYEHRLVLFDKIGPWDHECYWCKKSIRWGNDCDADVIVVDHLDGNEWNNTPENLVPSCRRCNIQRSIRPDFLTHCPKGHEYAVVGIYMRPNGVERNGRACKACMKERNDKRGEIDKERRRLARMSRRQI